MLSKNTTKMAGFARLSTTESYSIVFIIGFFGGGVIMIGLPKQYLPTRTRARYMWRLPATPPAYLALAEYDASLAKYTPRP